MPASPTLFRLVPKRSWTDRQGILQIVWTALAAISFIALIILFTLFIDLLVTHGRVSAREASRAEAVGLADPVVAARDIGLRAQALRFGKLTAWKWLPTVVNRITWTHRSFGATCLLVIGLFVSASALYWAATRAWLASVRAARQTTVSLRQSLHRQTLRLGPSDLSGKRAQIALELFTDECDRVGDALGQWRFRLVAAWGFVPLLLLMILAIDWRLGLQCLIPAIACWFVYRYETRHGASLRQLSEARAETEVRFLAEGLQQTRLVRGYHVEEFEQGMFDQHLDRLTKQTSAARRSERVAVSTARLIVRLGISLIVLLIALRILSPASPMLFASGCAMGVCLIALALQASSIDELVARRKEVESSGERLYRFLDEIPEVGQAVGAKFIEPVTKALAFESVRYQQGGNEILKGIDLKIEAKKQVAIVSMEPLAAKTLAYMLPRFIEPSKGRVLFDGEDIAWGTLESIRTEVLYVGHDDPVLATTVRDNLICGDSRYSIQDAIEAAKIAHIHKFITSLPQGYETILGEHGERLSPGDGFRLALARAILRDPAVLIIDEPEASLQQDEKALIDDAYQRIAQGRTVIFLPRRLSTLRRCDQVIMLSEGKLEAVGPHAELAKTCQLYRHWDYITFNAFSRQQLRSGASSRV